MGHNHTFAVIIAAGPALLLAGCHRSQDSRRSEHAPGGGSEPVLRADDDAKTVIDRAVKAHGGEKAFSRWNCGYVKYRTKGGIIPAQLGAATVADTFQLPGHFKRVAHIEADEKRLPMVFVINNGKGWTKDGNAAAVPTTNNFTEQIAHPFAVFCNLAPLMEGEPRLTKLGEGLINGREALGVRLQSDKFGQVEFYFEKQTGLLLKTIKTLPAANRNKPAVLEAILDDYKDVQGSMVPMRITGIQDGNVIVNVTILDMSFADKFDENTFTKP
jgi:hypothetical protein